jgi:deoxyribonucleoside regulator
MLPTTDRSAPPDRLERERHDRLVEIAWLHHEYGMTQEAIALRMGVSRSTISRALRDAEVMGIVQVTLTEPLPRELQLSEQLAATLGIVAHVGTRSSGDEDLAGEMVAGRTAARLIERIASAGHLTIATSWGRTLSVAARSVRRRRTEGVVVVDAVGHASGGEIAPALDVTRDLASALGATAIHLSAPAFADRASIAFLASSRPVEQALELARSADVVLTSVGVAGSDSLLVAEGFVDNPTMERLVAAGAVGEILGWYYDRAGRPVTDPSLATVGLSMVDLRACHRVIAVAAGERKAVAVQAAAAGGLVTEVVVDDRLAGAVLTAAAVAPDPGWSS